MSCTLAPAMLSTQSVSAASSPHQSNLDAERFSQLLQSPCEQAANLPAQQSEVYVSKTSQVADLSASSSLVNTLTRMQSLVSLPSNSFSEATSRHSAGLDFAAEDDVADVTNSTAPSAMESLQQANNQLISMQHELFRLTLTVETVNTTKQGVSTLFHNQG